jgi:hypothetical protein
MAVLPDAFSNLDFAASHIQPEESQYGKDRHHDQRFA